MTAANHILPDVLDHGLSVVFCGTAVGNASSRMAAYYAHPNNQFWSILHETGLTSTKLKPHEYAGVGKFGIGLTDLCKHVSGLDSEIPKVTEDDRQGLIQKIENFRPRFLAFTSKEAGKRFLKGSPPLGLSSRSIGGTKIFVLPSTSLMAAWQWNDTKMHWQDLAGEIMRDRKSSPA